jgi:putative membrane protein
MTYRRAQFRVAVELRSLAAGPALSRRHRLLCGNAAASGTRRIRAAASASGRSPHSGPAGWCWALAITSPLHWLGERLFSAHMIEHELMMVVAAPLMAYARINGALLWSLPRGNGALPRVGWTQSPPLIAACWRASAIP